MPQVKNLDIDVEINVLTTGVLAEITNSILELLLHQRNQIEFVYKTFRIFVNEWRNTEIKEQSNASLHYYMLGRQREKAIQTKESISAMQQLIDNAFQMCKIKSLRFLFGATTYTPKEAYTIHLPNETTSLSHLHDHHRLPKMQLNQLLLSLLTREELCGIFSNNLGPTNLYLELEILEENFATGSISKLLPKQLNRLPASCRDIHLHLRHKIPCGFDKSMLNCCGELEVFSDIVTDSRTQQEVANEKIIAINEVKSSNWWEADIIVRGFKEKLIKGHSIWKK